MKAIIDWHLWIILMIMRQVSAVPYNQPKFCPNASWNSNAITFANSILVGTNPYKVFVNTNNSVYVANYQYGRVIVWSEGNMTPIRNISGLTATYSLFVTTSGDIYVNNNNLLGQIDKFSLNSTIGVPTMYTCGWCYDIFVDLDNTLYCSMEMLHQVVAKSLKSNSNALKIVAGTGTAGNTAYRLNHPTGIFVDRNFDLYVADDFNHRIQLFRSGQLNGTTVAGSGSLHVTITLSFPTGVVLDGDGYLFIADNGNSRIVGSGPNGFRCIVGCNGLRSSAPTDLDSPPSLSFDSYGNIFVADFWNNRIQKFILMTNSCTVSTTATTQKAITSTINTVKTSINTLQSNHVTVSSSSNKSGTGLLSPHTPSPSPSSSIHGPPVRADRLNAMEVNWARRQRLQEIQMWSILQEIFTYLCFLSILCIMTYSNQQSNSFLQVDHLRKSFLNSRESHLDYTKISTINEYWKWLENSFASNIRAQQWYNGETPRNLSGFIHDKSNRLIGWPTMRQLRIKPDLCSYQKLRSNCFLDYNFINEEKDSFLPGWINETVREYSSSIRRAFQYQSEKELNTYVYVGEHGSYSGNGYVYEFRGRLSDIQSNLSELHRLEWIDNHTRAMIIQLSLYNPNVELFTSVTFLIEFFSTGGVQSSARIEPFTFTTSRSTSQLICSIIYIILIIYFMFVEIHSFIQLKWVYFHRLQSYIELGIIISSWINVGIHTWRYQEFQRISSLFRETNGYIYINLQLASYVNDISTYLFAFCCFFGTIRFLHLCQLNRRLSLFSQTLCKAGQRLLSFSMMFSIVFFAFLCLFYFLFNSHLWSCSSLLHTAQMLFEMTLMQFDAHELINAATFLGPFCFSLFILLVVFICMSMFLSIINESFQQARESVNRNNDEEIFSFMFDKFLRWTDWRKATEKEIYLERDARMRLEYVDPIECFPEKIDQLLDVINRLYMMQRMEGLKMEETALWFSRFNRHH